MKNYITLIFLFIGTLTFSQTFHLSGKVTDEENTPVDFAEVILSVRDSVLGIELTGEDGSFTFSGLPQENYTLTLKQAGEILHTQTLFLTDNQDLGNIRIQKAKELQNVVVTGQKKL
ncbi:MAG: carboxypeptidase-like regulatory domain-containing protein, partial [Flavobacteriaceae bacterium]|nr:carboxypeptidase-like regulatory domain-containing protein [Flavobacteriaceae bacterium]